MLRLISFSVEQGEGRGLIAESTFGSCYYYGLYYIYAGLIGRSTLQVDISGDSTRHYQRNAP